MAGDDLILDLATDRVKKMVEDILHNAGLPTNLKGIIGRMFQFRISYSEPPLTIVVGTIRGLTLYDEEIFLEISNTFHNADAYIYGIYWSKGAWELKIEPDGDVPQGVPGYFELL